MRGDSAITRAGSANNDVIVKFDGKLGKNG
jgi:hypothetical protein